MVLAINRAETKIRKMLSDKSLENVKIYISLETKVRWMEEIYLLKIKYKRKTSSATEEFKKKILMSNNINKISRKIPMKT